MQAQQLNQRFQQYRERQHHRIQEEQDRVSRLAYQTRQAGGQTGPQRHTDRSRDGERNESRFNGQNFHPRTAYQTSEDGCGN